jgi:hypothetical protein
MLLIVRAVENGKLDPDELDADWTISPKIDLPVHWIWIHALATAWERYKEEGHSLGHAFGLEGGQGKLPTIEGPSATAGTPSGLRGHSLPRCPTKQHHTSHVARNFSSYRRL